MRRIFASFAVVLLAAGCGSDVPGDPAGPVKLVRIMVQDSLPQGVRGVAMDLLDTPGSPLTTAHACSDSAPCVVNYTFQHVSPDVSCSAAGFCTDPIAAGLAPLVPPETHRPGEAGGTQIRLVFNKLLPASVDTAKVIELDDASGAAVAGTVAWDPSGSQDESSDLIIAPYGPALVFRPTAPLHASASYTIKVNAALVTDRDGNPMADQNGVVVAGTYTKSFTTEGAPAPAADHADQDRRRDRGDADAGRHRAARLQRAGGVDGVHRDDGRRAGDRDRLRRGRRRRRQLRGRRRHARELRRRRRHGHAGRLGGGRLHRLVRRHARGRRRRRRPWPAASPSPAPPSPTTRSRATSTSSASRKLLPRARFAQLSG